MLLAKKIDIKKKISFKLFYYILTSIFLLLSILIYNENKIKIFLKEDIILKNLIKEFGIAGADRNVNKKDIFLSFLNNLPYNILPINTFETLYLDIDFESFEQLMKDKDQALKEKFINSKEVSWVKGQIRFRNKSLNSNIRIKGDMLDHVATKKVSLRINIIDNGIFNMKKISLQSPKTRDFHTEQIFNNLLNFVGVFVPKSFYVNLIVNGDSWGTMYLQEHPSETFTNNSSRPYGPIFKIDNIFSFYNDDLFWSSDKNLSYSASKLMDFYNQPEENYLLLDEKIWVKYIAVSFLFKCWHGDLGKNIRVYFNPINKKFEPISYNNSCASIDSTRKLKFLPKKDQFIFKLIKIKKFRKILISEIKKWKYNPKYLSFLNEIPIYENDLRKKLSIDAKFLQKINVSTDHLDDVINWLKDDDNFKERTSYNYEQQKVFVPNETKFFPYITKKNGSYNLILFNFDNERYQIKYILLNLKNKKKQKIKFDDKEVFTLNNSPTISLDNFIKNDLNSINDIKLIYIDKKFPNFKIITKDLNLSFDKNIKDDFKTFSNYINKKNYNANIKLIRELFWIDDINKKIHVKENEKIYIKKSIILPPDYEFIIDKGVNFQFSTNASLIVNNKININGDINNPVIFSGINDNFWPGIIILANNEEVYIDSLIIRNATGKNILGFDFRGGFTLHRAKNFKMENVNIFKSLSEDAINIIESNGKIENLNVKNTKSDALDLDFSKVDIFNSNFKNIGSSTGADAIDLSGSTVNIKRVNITNVKDKAISVGENSISDIENVIIENSLVGIAVKDSSKVKGNDINFSNIEIANVMTYIKKDYFDGSKVNLSNIEFSKDLFINQKNSSLIVNERIIQPENLDVKELYETVMKSNK